MNSNKKRVKKGFTLLEILLVIAAIGILAAIVLVAINPTRQINQARQAAVNSDKNTIEKALQQALIDTGNYPAELDGVQRKICSNTVTTDCINLSSVIPDYIAAIPSSTTYTVARGNDGRVYVNTTETSANLSCPTGYIKIPGNSLYQTKDFCVMKYEAKAVDISDPTVGLTTPVTTFDGVTRNTIDNIAIATTGANGRAVASVASGYPIANIDQPTAAQYCTDAGASLINNREWLTIARNIEGQGANWTGGTVGSGGLWRGHSDRSPDNPLEASTDDNDGYFGTGNTSPSIERRTHTLSNGETIWDLSGNVWERTSDTIMGVDKPTGGFEFTAITGYGTLSYDLVRPSNNTWNSSQNMGRPWLGSVTGGPFAFLRGGGWNNVPAFDNLSGVFTLFLFDPPSFTYTNVGFRCVLR